MHTDREKMSEKSANDLIIQNIGAMQSTQKLSVGEKSEVRNDIKGTRRLICWLYDKFKRKDLEAKDFENALRELECDENANITLQNGSEQGEEDLDKSCPVEYELDYQDGEIKVTGTSAKEVKAGKANERESKKEGKLKGAKAQDEKIITKQMKHLMTTFEQEKKNLLRKVGLEKEIIAKQVADDYERKLKVEKDFLGTVIADLVKSVEDGKRQIQELQMIREHDRMTLQKLFKRKLADERKKMLHEANSGCRRA